MCVTEYDQLTSIENRLERKLAFLVRYHDEVGGRGRVGNLLPQRFCGQGLFFGFWAGIDQALSAFPP